MTTETIATVPTVRISKIMPARREDVFNAWLDAEGMRTWMCPGDIKETEIEIDARVGGRFRLVMHGGENDYEMTGEYVEIDPPSRIAFTWISHTAVAGSLVTLEFHDRGEETELVLTHERLPSADIAAQHEAGWGSILEKLAGRLAA
ncbi:MAG: SRPBCC domain-containing protein [Alphaproteobacteria bacterium]|nr:SRPBCC domain-containing protein [Alphaproteobacteria bacterium]